MKNNRRTRKLLFSSKTYGKSYMQMKQLETILPSRILKAEMVPVYSGGKMNEQR